MEDIVIRFSDYGGQLMHGAADRLWEALLAALVLRFALGVVWTLFRTR